MGSRDPQEASERIEKKLRDAGAGREWTTRHVRAARDEVQRGIDEGRIKQPGRG